MSIILTNDDRSILGYEHREMWIWFGLPAPRLPVSRTTHHVRRHNFHHIQMEIILSAINLFPHTYVPKCHGYEVVASVRLAEWVSVKSTKFKFFFLLCNSWDCDLLKKNKVIWSNLNSTRCAPCVYANGFDRRPYSCVCLRRRQFVRVRLCTIHIRYARTVYSHSL